MGKRVAKRKISKPIVASVTAAAVFAGGFFGFRVIMEKKNKTMSAEAAELDTAMTGDIKSVKTGEAAVEPYERYEIISMVSGDIISCPYDVGDMVEKGAVLYQFDTSDVQTSIKKQEISLEQSKNSLDNAKSDLSEAQSKLTITAPNSGIISGLEIKAGSSVNNGTSVATIDNTENLEVTLPFTREQVNEIYVGASAQISSSVHMSSVSGRVKSISSHAQAQENGSNLYSVRIEFTNPGAFTQGLTVGGSVNGMDSPGQGKIEYSESGNAKAEASGTILSVNYSNGDYVRAGAVIATISSDELSSQERSVKSSELNLKNAQLSMQETKDGLEDYSIKAPISGTVITKNSKAGDTIDRTNSSQTLMVIADISKLKFSMDIDELDVSMVHEGQKVDITCDALPDEEFEGVIESISVEGTATNGVTSYAAEVVIDNPGNLRPSMNVDASVIVESAENVLIVPTADIKTIMGVSYVFLKDETGERASTEEDFENALRKDIEKTMEENPETAENVPDGRMPGDGAMPETNGNMPSGKIPIEEVNTETEMDGKKESSESFDKKEESDKKSSNEDKNEKDNQKSRIPEAPEGFVTVIVETGISDDDNTEIISGLKAGDKIQRLTQNVTSTDRGTTGMPGGGMGGMGGMMGSGGAPGGGSFGGGAPGGGGMR